MTANLLLPEIMIASTACLFFVVGCFVRRDALWGVLAVATLVVAGGILWCEPTAAKQTADSGLILDGKATIFRWFGLLVGLAFAVAALRKERESSVSAECFGLLMLSVTGMMLTATAGDLLVLFLALELVVVPLYVLMWLARSETGAERSAASQDAARMYCLLGLLASLVLLYGFSLLYGVSGTVNLTEMSQAVVAESPANASGLTAVGKNGLGVVAMLVILAGLGMRMGIVPFHFGQIDVLEDTTAWNAGLLCIVPRVAAVVVAMRVLIEGMPGFERTGRLAVILVAAVTMAVGAATALRQVRLRGMLASLATAHMGFALMALAAGFGHRIADKPAAASVSSIPGGEAACVVWLVVYGISIGGLFVFLSYLEKRDRRIEHIEDLAGLFRDEPWAAGTAVILLASLAGLPLTIGFWSRWSVFIAGLSMPVGPDNLALTGVHPGFVLLAFLAMAHLLASVAVSLKIISAMFLDGRISRPQPTGGKAALAVVVLAAVASVVGGLSPKLILQVALLSEWP